MTAIAKLAGLALAAAAVVFGQSGAAAVQQAGEQTANLAPARPAILVGLQTVDEDIATAIGHGGGELVRSVIKGGPAEQAGLRVGDLLLQIDGKAVTKERPASMMIAEGLIGAPLRVTLLRDGRQIDLNVRPIARPSEADKLYNSPALADYMESGNAYAGDEDAAVEAGGGMTLLTLTPAIAGGLDLPATLRGAVVKDVAKGGSAEEQGLKRGDVILSVSSRKVAAAREAAEAITAALTSERKSALLYVTRSGSPPAFVAVAPQSKVAATAHLWGVRSVGIGHEWVDGDGYIWKYYWLERGKRMNSFKRLPGEKVGKNTEYALQPDGTLLDSDGVKYRAGPAHYEYWTKGQDGKPFAGLMTVERIGDALRYTAQEVRGGRALKPFHQTTERLLKPGEEAQLASAAKARKLAAQQAARNEAAAAAERQSEGGGLLGALQGAVGGIWGVASGGGGLEEGLAAAAIGAGAGAAGVDAATINNAFGSLDYGSGVGAAASAGGLASSLGGGGGGGNARPPVGMPGCDAVGVNSGNYRSAALSGGNDVQLKTMCGQAFEYYAAYKRALDQGYSEADANRTYDAHQKSALVANDFYANNRAN